MGAVDGISVGGAVGTVVTGHTTFLCGMGFATSCGSAVGANDGGDVGVWEGLAVGSSDGAPLGWALSKAVGIAVRPPGMVASRLAFDPNARANIPRSPFMF